MLVSYDGPDVAGQSYAEQIARAQRLQASNHTFAIAVLLKPPGDLSQHSISELSPSLADLPVLM